MWRTFCGVLLLGILTISVGQSDNDSSGLYGPPEGLAELKGVVDFRSQVIGSKTAWAVQFYLNWCDDCVGYVKTWTDLAVSVKAWKPVISLAVVDCASDENEDICNNYSICTFPTLLFLPPAAEEADPGKTYRAEEVGDILRTIVDFLTEIADCPNDCRPTLRPIVNMKDFWEETRNSSTLVAFVFEDNDSYLGREVILDMSMQRKYIQVWRLLTDAGDKFGILSFPSLQLVNQDRTFTPLSENDKTRSGYVKALTKQLATSTTNTAKGETGPSVNSGPTERNPEAAAQVNPEPAPAVDTDEVERSNTDYSQEQKAEPAEVETRDHVKRSKTDWEEELQYFVLKNK